MFIKLNGKKIKIDKKITLLELITTKFPGKQNYIIEYNKKIISNDRIENIFVSNKDSIEVLIFTGGG